MYGVLFLKYYHLVNVNNFIKIFFVVIIAWCYSNWFWYHLSFYSGWLLVDAKKLVRTHYDSSVDGLSEWRGLMLLFLLDGYIRSYHSLLP